MVEELPIDIESCHRMIIDQRQLIAALLTRVEALSAEVERLKVQLNRNSGNSHTPPSQDQFNKPKPKPAFGKTGTKRNGGQPGHVGRTLAASSAPDEEIVLRPDRCGCGSDLTGVVGECVERRQVVDLPPMKLEYCEYQRIECCCPSCGQRSSGSFPEGVSAPVQYGPQIRSLSVILSVEYHLSLEKISELFGDLFGAPMNQSTIVSSIEQSHQLVKPSLEVIGKRIVDSAVVHSDETGIYVENRRQWLHTASTALYTFQFVHPKRGRQALESAESLLPECRGWLVHDCWSAYFGFEQAQHAVCGAHLLRELQALIEQGKHWAALMKRLLLAIYHITRSSNGVLPDDDAARAIRIYRQILARADLEEPPAQRHAQRGRLTATKGRNLFERLRRHESAVLAFALHQVVPFTNNQAERDIRPSKTKQKVSGCFRTLVGAQQYVRLHSFFSTARKHGVNAWQALRDISLGRSFLTAGTPIT